MRGPARWGRRGPGIDSEAVGAVLVRIRARSCAVPAQAFRTGRCLGCVQPHAAEERLERASREPPRWGWGGRLRQKASPGRHAHAPRHPKPPATQPSIVGPPRRWVSAVSSPHLPLFIILREIQREIFLRGEEGRQKERKSGSREMRRRLEREGGRGDICGMRVGGPRPPHMAHPAASPSPPPLTALESHWNHTLDRASPLAPSLAVRGGNRRLGASTRGRRLRPL